MKQISKTRVGIPRALLYYEFSPVWKAFLEELGLNVIVSGNTTDRVVKRGIGSTGGDLCLPVKIFLGHVHEIKESVDFLFIPRYISVEEDAYMCPKFLGLPDMVRASISPLPPIIDAPMNIKKGGLKEFLDSIAKPLRIERRVVKDAYRKAEELDGSAIWHEVSFRAERGMTSGDCHGSHPRNDKEGVDLKIALLGRPYVLYDTCINRSIIKRLNAIGADVVIKTRFSQEEIKEAMSLLPKVLYWSMGKEVVTSAYYFMRNSKVDGIINLVSVACGPDSFTSEIINGFKKKMDDIPYMVLYLDEHTSDVGVLTRIEGFLDMIKRKKGVA